MIQRLRAIVAAVHRLVTASGALIDGATPTVDRFAPTQPENSR
jgi:hypothetical protein